MPVFIKTGYRYYFWDKRRNKLGSFVVDERRSNGFSFRYEGRQYVSSFVAAGGKVFTRDIDVPQYREELMRLAEERQRRTEESLKAAERELEKERAKNYRPSPDTIVVFGD